MDVDQFKREYIHTPAAVLREIDGLADILARLDHSWFDDTAGSSGDPGPFVCNWYGVMSDKDKGFHAIVRQSNDGFNYCETFDNGDQCADTWAKIQLDALEIALENEDYDYFGCTNREELLDAIEKRKSLINSLGLSI
jgi:hypothetical protein